MSPPMMCAMRWAMVRPRPVPPNLRVEELSTWVKGWKRRSRSSREMPDPLSLTENSKPTRRSEIRRPRTV
ncbi:hypothetical protein D3C72_2222890 [compost metagenome]